MLVSDCGCKWEENQIVIMPYDKIEFAKSRAMVPVWSTCSRVNLSTCKKHADFSLLRANVPINLPTCQGPKGVPIFQLHQPKGVPFCQKNFCSWMFQLCITFTNFYNISATVENFSWETKNVNFDICKISLRKNRISLKPL